MPVAAAPPTSCASCGNATLHGAHVLRGTEPLRQIADAKRRRI
jgi:hypothetical protein